MESSVTGMPPGCSGLFLLAAIRSFLATSRRGGCVRRQLGAQFVKHVAQLRAHEVTRGHVLEREAQAGYLAGEILGVGQVAFGAQAILFCLDAVARVLTVLREHDEGGRIRGLGGECEVQQNEGVGIPRRLLADAREHEVGADPGDNEDRHVQDELG